jgi:predicted enzyme related to lactoylglutathione lyase
MPRPVHFEIHATDPAAVQAFYETVFGSRFSQWGDVPYWLINTGDGDPMSGVPHTEPGLDGGMVPRQGGPAQDGQPVNAWVVTVDVPDCQEYLDRAVAAGGTVALPRNAMPGVGWLAYFKDPDGNLVGLMQPDPNAAPES